MGEQSKSASVGWGSFRTRAGSRKGNERSTALSQMHAEGRLLILCARTVVSEFARVEVEDLVSDGVQWDRVWQLSRAHGVAPLV
ncbi:MAG TPA: hypothetical protein DCQ94_06750, partial [Nitrospira sp.]|nr:hypothetical protein [Nitrospira sp.]